MLAPPFYRRASAAASWGLLLGARSVLAQEPVAAGPAAAPGPLALSWVSSEPSCEGASVASRALELVAHGVTPRPTEAHAQVARDGDQWVVELETHSESKLGRRTLRGESCKEIQQAIALLLAMILESEAKAELPPAPPAGAPAAAPTAPPEASLDSRSPELDGPPRSPTLPVPKGFGGLLRSDGTAAMGLQPSLGLGVGGSIGAALGPFELQVGGGYWPASRATIFDRDGSLEMTRKVLSVTACYQLWGVGPLRALPCVSPELAWLKWHSLGLRVTNQGEKDHLEGLTAFLDLRLELFGPLFLSIAPGLTWERPQPFRAKRCENCAPTDVFQTWGIAPRLGAGVGARF